ncbi:CPBP family intramembrane glutamic endopeptidase [Alkalibacter saccharofermentans]|uniref:CAAX protease self-immunity n=1 Tax=Alkalibacter saccharofermentans DSM 14828 TaxID=1120975 RepID=A0A1M4WCA6_9FIRM|nr:CPBP family intramembrane glutamic endopeptidase [Alkalibacter saccharofermentans]SHE78898.1 CAAX protease self-immunity [Alkalibacter saccharofermentans DSM 14828]
MNKVLKSILWVLFLSLILLGVPRLSGMIANLFDYQATDPDGAYAWISVRHMFQALIFVIFIVVLNIFKPLEYGFGWGNKEVGKKYVLSFTVIFCAGSFVSHLLTILTSSFQQFPYPLTASNIIGQLSFQLLLSGPSEELIFRAFAITMLGIVIKNRGFNGKASAANIIAAVIFGLAHMSFSFAPFAVVYNPFQVVMATVLGLFYGDCYEKSKSMYYPMMMHSISNIVMVGLTIIATFILSR